MRPDVLVVGGGVIGSAIAYQLARRGARGVLCDPGLPGPAWTASAGVITAPTEGTDDPLRSLAVESARLYPALCAELLERTGIEAGLRSNDVLYVALTDIDELELRRRRDTLARVQTEVHWLDGRQARELEPALSKDVRGVLVVPHQQQVLVATLVAALRRACVDLGVIVRTDRVERLEVEGERVNAILSDGGRLGAGEAVIASGAWAAAFAEGLRVPLPLRPVRGQMVRLAAPGSLLRSICFGPRAYVVPKADGSIHVGATVEEAGFDPRVTAGAVAALLSGADAILPAIRGATFVEAHAGLRPATPDGKPLLGRIAGRAGLTIAAGHFREGVLLAPITAELIADLVLLGRPRLPLAPFDPMRFAPRAA